MMLNECIKEEEDMQGRAQHAQRLGRVGVKGSRGVCLDVTQTEAPRDIARAYQTHNPQHLSPTHPVKEALPLG